MDPRILNLSYSSILTLHSCPRKFQLYKLGAQTSELEEHQSLTFLFGHIVGQGVQDVLVGKSLQECLFNAFINWDMDLFAEDTRRGKSFWVALYAIETFSTVVRPSVFEDWELVYTTSGPAVEMSFMIKFADGFKYRGFVDAVLKNVHTGEVMVLEVKTTSSKLPHPAQYKNSFQAVGYSVVLDTVFPGLSSYQVLYLPFLTKEQIFYPMPFNKSYLQRANWIQELFLQTQIISLYEQTGIYPQHGENCYNFFRECEYYHCCNLSTNLLAAPIDEEKLAAEDEKYEFVIDFYDLVAKQLENHDDKTD